MPPKRRSNRKKKPSGSTGRNQTARESNVSRRRDPPLCAGSIPSDSTEEDEEDMPPPSLINPRNEFLVPQCQSPISTTVVSDGDDSEDSEEPPPLLSRTSMRARTRHTECSSSDDDDDDRDGRAAPPMQGSQQPTRNSGFDEDTGSLPDLSYPKDCDSSDDSDVPDLLERNKVNSDEDSDADSVVPYLSSNIHSSDDESSGGGIGTRSATKVSSKSNSVAKNSNWGFERGFLNNNGPNRSASGWIDPREGAKRLDKLHRKDEKRDGKQIKNNKQRLSSKDDVDPGERARRLDESNRKEEERINQIKKFKATIKLQSWARMVLIYTRYAESLQKRVASAKEYCVTWGRLEDLIVHNKLPAYEVYTWEDIKIKQLDRMNVLFPGEEDLVDEEELELTNKRLDSAIVTALEEKDEEPRHHDDDSNEHVTNPENVEDEVVKEADTLPDGETALCLPTSHRIDQIQLTKDVLKWLDRQDSKYRGFFIRRIQQLADGERSRILKKHLTGSKTAIWETYLDQKSGQRILWTECETYRTRSCGKMHVERGILVWYVAKHDAVSRLMRQIDSAQNRTCLQSRDTEKLTSAMSLFDDAKEDILKLEDGNRILADPLGDTPLKIHLLYRPDIRKLTSKEWKPRLHLTAEELRVVDKDGTVLLLGRSGTGKTICIANRMDRDRENNEIVTQLFVARSRRICSYVRGLVEGTKAPRSTVQYLTFGRFIERCERVLGIRRRRTSGDWGDNGDVNQMTFARFKLQVYKQCAFHLDPLIVWSQIRSFIKGSIEAVMAGRPLTLREYLELGKSRCRLAPEHRELAYSAFEAYRSFLETNSILWDDTDRILEILAALRCAPTTLVSELCFQKIYVDEIQDYTQAEIAAFFYLGSPGGLFLAGDTAQSVVEGVDFRFEEVRSIGHRLFEDRRYIPDKPVTVNVNFRSHSGILNVAAAILDRMFKAFPKSANALDPDVGAFTGPRPSLLQGLTIDKLRELVSLIDSVVLLTHDDHVQALKENVGENVLVLGIRYSKGLEFPHVVIVDFFSCLHMSHHKAWKRLLSIRSVGDAGVEDLKETSPEVETQLKLLYTGITRCSKRLFFAETKKSIAGDSFRKWLLKKDEQPLASEQTVDSVDQLRKTQDEWLASGVDFGVEAENSEDSLEQARLWLTQARHDFGKASNSDFLARTDAHLSAIDFRINLTSLVSRPEPRLDLQQQKVAADTILNLLKVSLVEEAAKLMNLTLPFVAEYTRLRLLREVSSCFPCRPEDQS